jgi:hypothetical protein
MCMFSSLWPSSYFRFTVLWLSCRSFSRYSLTRLGLDTCDLLALVCYGRVYTGGSLDFFWACLLYLTPLIYLSWVPSWLSSTVLSRSFFFYFDLYWPFRRLLSSLPYFMLVLSVVTYFLLHTCISLLFFCDFFTFTFPVSLSTCSFLLVSWTEVL